MRNGFCVQVKRWHRNERGLESWLVGEERLLLLPRIQVQFSEPTSGDWKLPVTPAGLQGHHP